MEPGTEFFTAKLTELKEVYETLINSMTLPHERSELQRLYNDMVVLAEEDENKLKQFSDNSKLPFLSKLNQMQLDYYYSMKTVANKELSNNMGENKEEMSALFSEYMIDAAMYSVKQAILSFLNTAFIVSEDKEKTINRNKEVKYGIG